MSMLASTPKPPYYAVIFSSERTRLESGYAEMSRRMMELATLQPGFLGVDSARSDGLGITVSYWRDESSIRAWKDQLDHREAQRLGREKWYARYCVRVARVERDYEFGITA